MPIDFLPPAYEAPYKLEYLIAGIIGFAFLALLFICVIKGWKSVIISILCIALAGGSAGLIYKSTVDETRYEASVSNSNVEKMKLWMTQSYGVDVTFDQAATLMGTAPLFDPEKAKGDAKFGSIGLTLNTKKPGVTEDVIATLIYTKKQWKLVIYNSDGDGWVAVDRTLIVGSLNEKEVKEEKKAEAPAEAPITPIPTPEPTVTPAPATEAPVAPEPAPAPPVVETPAAPPPAPVGGIGERQSEAEPDPVTPTPTPTTNE